MENIRIRAYYHRRELKKCYLLIPDPVVDIRFGNLVPGGKYLGLRQLKNTFGLELMESMVSDFLEDYSWDSGFLFGTPVSELWTPPGLVVDALPVNKVLRDWSSYGDYQNFSAPGP